MYRYEQDGNEYILMDGDAIVRRLESVAVAIDMDSFTLHEHGDPLSVAKRVGEIRNKLLAAGGSFSAEMARQIVIINYPFTAAELNRILDTSGYVEKLCREKGIRLREWSPDDVTDICPSDIPEYSVLPTRRCAGYQARLNGETIYGGIVDVSLQAALAACHEHALQAVGGAWYRISDINGSKTFLDGVEVSVVADSLPSPS